MPAGISAEIEETYARTELLLESPGKREAQAGEFPYWILIPREVSRLWNRAPGSRRVDPGTMADIRWAQYCLFLSIRMQDDVLDGESSDPAMLFAANLFSGEAGRVYCRCAGSFPRARRFFLECIETTSRAILAVRRLQQYPESPGKLLSLPPAVNAIFKPALFAVCLHHRKPAAYGRLERAYDALAAAGQLLDDYHDLVEDLRSGRANLAAQLYLAGKNRKVLPSPKLARPIRAAMRRDGGARCFGLICRRLEEAEKSLGAFGMEAVDRYLLQYRRHVAAEARALLESGKGGGIRDWF